MPETPGPARKPMTMATLVHCLKHSDDYDFGLYRESIYMLLLVAMNRMEADPDEAAAQVHDGALAARRLHPNAFKADNHWKAGYTVLAARTCTIWLGSYLAHSLPRSPVGKPDLHQTLDDLSGRVFGPGNGSPAPAVMQLHRAIQDRAGELRAAGAYETVRGLTAYGGTHSIHVTHGRLTLNTLRLALPHDLPDPGLPSPPGQGHLTLAQSLQQAMAPALPQ
ncbi:hypothetical protein ACIQIG_32840 [Streptomyces bacillaris]|uniref:hypothetical protein n=1 Tax=Streptomyces bacillaris TaxID=68179 RepID=UPI00345F2351